MKKLKFLVLFIIAVSLAVFAGCSVSEITKSTQDKVNAGIDETKQQAADKMGEYIENKVDKQISTVVTSIESNLDPKLGQVRKDMGNIKEAVLVYYKINNKMPAQQKIEPFFEKSFSNMKIQYKISNDGQRSFIIYIGKDYGKDKIPDIVVDPKANK